MEDNLFMSTLQNEQGQSLLETIILLPFLFMLVAVLYKMMMATQMAIANTQYARSQLYVLTANSPEYPRLEFRLSSTMFAAANQDRMILGVSDPSALTSSSGQDGTIEPVPQQQNIVRAGSTVKGSSDRGEVQKRTLIRIRNTAGICTQINAVAKKFPMNEQNIPSLASKRWPFGISVCQYGGMI